MLKDKLYIYDSSFTHAKSSSWYNEPQKFDWVRNDYEQTDLVVTTNLGIIDEIKDKKVYGWLIEPPEIMSEPYHFIKNNYQKFEKIFTYDSELLKISDKFEFLPIGGCWIDEEDRKIYEKKKIVCSINSNKRGTYLQRFRHEVFAKVSNVDLYGGGFNPIDKKINVLKDYMFCIVIENQQMDYLFTEKIIDCFVTGTIPIYKGCPSIANFFNINGILTFETIDELNSIIKNILSKDFYDSKIESIKENFELSKKFTIADNIIYEKLKNGNK